MISFEEIKMQLKRCIRIYDVKIQSIKFFEEYTLNNLTVDIVKKHKTKEHTKNLGRESALIRYQKTHNKSDPSIAKFLYPLIEELNQPIRKKNQAAREKKKAYKKQINEISNIINTLNSNVIYSDEIPSLLDKIELILTDVGMNENEKSMLMSDISNYLNQKKQEYVEREDEEQEEYDIEEEKDDRLFKINNYEYITEILKNYANTFPQEIYEIDIGNHSSKEEINNVLQNSFSDLDDGQFSLYFLYILSLIDKETKEEKIKYFAEQLDQLCSMYALLSEYDMLKKEIDDVSSLKVSPADEKILDNFKERLNKMNNKLYSVKELFNSLGPMHMVLHNMKRNILSEKIQEQDRLPIKTFILFDYEKTKGGQIVPYILSDFNPDSTKCTIDESLDQAKIITNGYYDFNELVDDLVIYGKPRVLLEPMDRAEKIEKPVYFTPKKRKKITKDLVKTGMYRLRPNISSYVRFIEEKVNYSPSNPNFQPMVDLLESKLNISIDRNEDFVIFINFVDSFKCADVSSYSTAIKRQRRSELKELLKKEMYTDDDLEQISSVIDSTLAAYKQLQTMNENFKFQTIRKMLEPPVK